MALQQLNPQAGVKSDSLRTVFGSKQKHSFTSLNLLHMWIRHPDPDIPSYHVTNLTPLHSRSERPRCQRYHHECSTRTCGNSQLKLGPEGYYENACQRFRRYQVNQRWECPPGRDDVPASYCKVDCSCRYSSVCFCFAYVSTGSYAVLAIMHISAYV